MTDERMISWEDLKSLVDKGAILRYSHRPEIGRWTLYIRDGSIYLFTIIYDPGFEPEGAEIQNAEYLVEFQADYQTTSNILVEPRTPEGQLEVAQVPLPGAQTNFYSPNICDQCTWYYGSSEIDEFPLTSVSTTIYNTDDVHPVWVDLKHGRMFNEDNLLLENPELELLVEVSTDDGATWVPKTENSWDPEGGSPDGDYSADYSTGTVTFNSPLEVSDLVRASFATPADTFLWVLGPNANQRLLLLRAEIQFTEDVVMTGSLSYQTWAYNPADLPNKIAVTTPMKYKTRQDVLWEAVGTFPVLPAWGGSSPPEGRGLTQQVMCSPFLYHAFRDIRSSQGTEIRLFSDKPGPFTGEFASVTFYCLQKPE